MVRAKFKYTGYESCLWSQEVRDENGKPKFDDKGRTIYEDVEMRTLKFAPVFSNGDTNHENSKFWRASPSGEVRLGTVNQAAWSQFEFGKEYYLDFSPAIEGGAVVASISGTEEVGTVVSPGFVRAAAEHAYSAYGEVTGWKNFQGNQMPKFAELPETIQKAWEAAATSLIQPALGLS